MMLRPSESLDAMTPTGLANDCSQAVRRELFARRPGSPVCGRPAGSGKKKNRLLQAACKNLLPGGGTRSAPDLRRRRNAGNRAPGSAPPPTVPPARSRGQSPRVATAGSPRANWASVRSMAIAGKRAANTALATAGVWMRPMKPVAPRRRRSGSARRSGCPRPPAPPGPAPRQIPRSPAAAAPGDPRKVADPRAVKLGIAGDPQQQAPIISRVGKHQQRNFRHLRHGEPSPSGRSATGFARPFCQGLKRALAKPVAHNVASRPAQLYNLSAQCCISGHMVASHNARSNEREYAHEPLRCHPAAAGVVAEARRRRGPRAPAGLLARPACGSGLRKYPRTKAGTQGGKRR